MAQISANLKPGKRRGFLKRTAMIAFGFILAYLFVAYIFMPAWWKRDDKKHPSLVDIPNITHTKDGIPGDPLNVSLIGTKPDLVKAMLAAQWHPADSLSLKSCLEIAAATILERSYTDAPVSNLYLFGRKEDLAFEQPVGNDPKKRHHVRFWQTNQSDSNDRPVWIGSGTYDKRVGLSATTGQITHHIDEDVDTERDHVMQSLKLSGDLLESYMVDGFHKTLTGRNGGGDPWKTDGKLSCGVIAIKQSP
jgi:LssY C-terminus